MTRTPSRCEGATASSCLLAASARAAALVIAPRGDPAGRGRAGRSHGGGMHPGVARGWLARTIRARIAVARGGAARLSGRKPVFDLYFQAAPPLRPTPKAHRAFEERGPMSKRCATRAVILLYFILRQRSPSRRTPAALSKVHMTGDRWIGFYRRKPVPDLIGTNAKSLARRKRAPHNELHYDSTPVIHERVFHLGGAKRRNEPTATISIPPRRYWCG
jgi:hypothetical protein